MIRTLTGAVPPSRGDGIPFTSVWIEEADAQTGPFSTVANQPITPATDPANPTPINISYESPRVAAWIRLVFRDDLGFSSAPTSPVYDSGGGELAWVPTPEEVVPYVRARLKTPGGAEVSNFATDGTTRPTRQQVEQLINESEAIVRAAIGTVPPQLNTTVRSLVALGAAMNIELTFFPEQVARDQSPYEQYERRFDKLLAQTVEAAAEIVKTGDVIPGGPGSDAEGETLGSLKPQFYFEGIQVGNVYW